MFEIEKLSEKYSVKRLGESEVAAVVALCKGNPQSEHFWVKNGFERTGVEVPNEGYTVVVLEKELN